MVILNFDSNGIDEYGKTVSALYYRGSYYYAPKRLDLDLKNRVTPLSRQSIEQPLMLELKSLSSNL